MTRPEEIAAALQSRIDAARFDANSPGGWCAAAEYILRAANPPAGAERATEPFDWNKAKPFRSSDEWYSGKPSNDETHARTAATVQWLMEHGGRFPDDPEPATPYGRCPTCGAPGCNRERRPNGDDHCTNGHKYPSRDAVAAPAIPAVGEDEAIRKWLDARDCVGTMEAMMDAGDDLAARVSALLADVARERNWRVQAEAERDRALLRDDDALAAARADVARLTEERDNTTKALRRADSMLTAVRKIADDYHDVDVVGDPPREVACNPCANEILGVLEGRK